MSEHEKFDCFALTTIWILIFKFLSDPIQIDDSELIKSVQETGDSVLVSIIRVPFDIAASLLR